MSSPSGTPTGRISGIGSDSHKSEALKSIYGLGLSTSKHILRPSKENTTDVLTPAMIQGLAKEMSHQESTTDARNRA